MSTQFNLSGPDKPIHPYASKFAHSATHTLPTHPNTDTYIDHPLESDVEEPQEMKTVDWYIWQFIAPGAVTISISFSIRTALPSQNPSHSSTALFHPVSARKISPRRFRIDFKFGLCSEVLKGINFYLGYFELGNCQWGLVFIWQYVNWGW